MEKFGIFELLDALSAITAATDAPDAPAEESPSATDEVYKPPVYGNPPADAPKAPEPHADADALAGFLARHDAIAKKADGKKRD